ncbi:unnamed protein product, partial [Rotaria magnacalcarata]
VEKSKYINIISNACGALEMHIYEHCYKQERNFGEIGNEKVQDSIEGKRKKMDFEHWVNNNGSIKQVYTTASLLQMMVKNNLFFLANEGDAILQECSFFNPSDTAADVKQGTLIDCNFIHSCIARPHLGLHTAIFVCMIGWDGNKIVKSTVTHGSKEINHHTVSMCIGSTGRRWPDLLRELARVQIAGGLHERCTFFCFDVQGDGIEHLQPSAEKEFYSNLYDDLMSVTTQHNQINYSLVQVLCVVKLFGYRIFTWSREAFSYIQPRLNELKANKPCPLIQYPSIFKTKQHMAVRRRFAEHTVRYSCLIQMLFNAIQILKNMNENTTRNGLIDEAFEVEAKYTIMNIFGGAFDRSVAVHKNGVPIRPMKVTLRATTSAVCLVFSLLLPQAILLFNYESDDQDPVNQEAPVNDIKIPNKQQKLIIKIETFVINLDYKFFFKSCITERHFRDKRLLVDNVLSDMVKRKLLHEGHNDKAFFETGRLSHINTYSKFIPTPDDKQRFEDDLLHFYSIHYEDYLKQFQHAALLPPGCRLTDFGREFLRQPPYQKVLKEEVDKKLSKSPNETSSTRGQVTQNSAEVNDDYGNLSMSNRQLKSTTDDFEFHHIDSDDDIMSMALPINDILNEKFSEDLESDKIIAHKELARFETVERSEQLTKTNADEQGGSIRCFYFILHDLLIAILEVMSTTSNLKLLAGKLLLIPSIILTTGLISLYIKVIANDINEALEYLVHKKILKADKYIQSGKRQVEAYFKYVRNIIEKANIDEEASAPSLEQNIGDHLRKKMKPVDED